MNLFLIMVCAYFCYASISNLIILSLNGKIDDINLTKTEYRTQLIVVFIHLFMAAWSMAILFEKAIQK